MKSIKMKKMLTALLTACPAILFAQTGTYTLKGNLTKLKAPAKVYLSSNIYNIVMKKLLIAILTVIPCFLFAQNKLYTLNGTITGLRISTKAYLTRIMNGKVVLDSAEVKGGKFQFKGQIPGPVPAQLLLNHGSTVSTKNIYKLPDKLDLYLANGNIIIKAKDSLKNGIVSGLKINENYRKYNSFIAHKVHEMSFLNIEMRTGAADKTALRIKFSTAIKELKALQKEYIKANPDSYFSLIAVEGLTDGAINVAEVEPYYKSLSENVRNTPMGIAYAKQIEAARKTTLGVMAPDFTQNDVNDKPVKLSDFRGKYVLLDFWASWCVPCRHENPNVVKAFNKYKDKNFTVLSVSLDRPGGKQAWINAVKADGLNWTNVSDLKFWDNAVAKQYGVFAVPQNFLIDPNGKIIASGLHGENLDKKLVEIFDSN